MTILYLFQEDGQIRDTVLDGVFFKKLNQGLQNVVGNARERLARESP